MVIDHAAISAASRASLNIDELSSFVVSVCIAPGLVRRRDLASASLMYPPRLGRVAVERFPSIAPLTAMLMCGDIS